MFKINHYPVAESCMTMVKLESKYDIIVTRFKFSNGDCDYQLRFTVDGNRYVIHANENYVEGDNVRRKGFAKLRDILNTIERNAPLHPQRVTLPNEDTPYLRLIWSV